MSLLTTRLAPSPTGALHVGNARTFLLNHLLAAQNGWRVLMRMEDLDGPRVKPHATQEVFDDLQWLGLQWLEPIVYQSQRKPAYDAALQQLIRGGWAYPCTCTRGDIAKAASAPHQGEGLPPYPSTCRGRFASADEAQQAKGKPAAWRIRVSDEPIVVQDAFAGDRTFVLPQSCGDFVICRNNGTTSYQLAVVIDDADAGIDAIVRGDDLLESAARQIHLRSALGISPEPRYWHLPLVIGPDGIRIAKRHGDTRLSYYRKLGCTPQRMLGLLGYLCGLLERRAETDMGTLIERFDLLRLSHEPCVFTKADDAFLRG